ncbi:MAG: molybdopterin-guanine dinucleotide biosynthesis protein MobB [Peptococcaceae bacterium]|jgi:molybdopterin-guanine dinucleotide biosynthesis protein B|nr:molybdopterin-guanine dinucleotide biosynthesis protein MobB [Peptococcaceae bacterium]
MKAFSISGYSDSGKTTTAEHIIRELTSRGYKVGSIKEIHAEDFAIDGAPASDTARQRAAGSGLVIARGLAETDVMYPSKLDMQVILRFYEGFDYVLCESVRDLPMPMIVTAATVEDLDKNWNDFIFCVSGRVADEIGAYRDIPAISAMTGTAALADLIEKKVYEILPNTDPARCGICGLDCRRMGIGILRGEKKRSDCLCSSGPEIYMDGERVTLVPFVRDSFHDVVMGYVRHLKGYTEGAMVEIRIK